MRRLAVVVAVIAALLVPPSVGAGLSAQAAKRTVREIAALGQRPAGRANERRVAAMVRDRLAAYGYYVEVQRFVLPNGRYSRNVVGRGPGLPRAVVVAHIDGVWNTRAANDNASGVATMLEIARVLGGARAGVVVAGLGAEERAVTGSRYHLGSRRFVRRLSAAERESIRFAVSVDMVGVGGTLNVRGLEAEPNRSARRLLRAARALGYRASYLRDSGVSDHAEMTRAGIPAALLTWRWDSCWHLPCDTADRVERWKMYRAGRMSVRAARTVLPEGEATTVGFVRPLVRSEWV